MDSKSMYMIMQNCNAKTRDFSFLNLLFLQRLHRFTCVELAGGLLVDQYHHIARPEIWIQLLAPDRPLPRWLDKIPKVFTLDSSFPLSLFLQCSYNPSTSSVFHYLLTSLLFSPYLFNFFFPFVSLRLLHVDKALVSLFRCRMFWLLRWTTEYFVTALENMDMKHMFPV